MFKDYKVTTLEYCCINPITFDVDWDALCVKFPVFEQMKTIFSNPKWHSEGSVFDHTKMAYEWLISNREIKIPYLLLPAVLFHDIGKSQCPINDDGYCLSSGHEKISAELTKELLINLDHSILSQIVCLIEYHDLRFQYKTMKPQKIAQKIKTIEQSILENSIFLKFDIFDDLLKPLFEADYNGAIRQQDDSLEEDLNAIKSYYEKPNMIVMFGLPGSGKNYFIDNILPKLHFLSYKKKYTVISRDDIREELGYKNYNDCDEEKVTKIFKEKLKTSLENRENIIINNTNLRKKYRNEFFQMANSYNYDYKTISLNRPLNEIFEVRPKKTWEHVIKRMMKNMEFPSKDENVLYYNTEDFN